MKDNTVHQSLTLQALTDISKYISASLDYEEIAKNCLYSLSENMDLENCALLRPSYDKKNLEIQVGFSDVLSPLPWTDYVPTLGEVEIDSSSNSDDITGIRSRFQSAWSY